MLQTLKRVGKDVGRELGRAWENLSDGWREMLSRSGEALTHFSRDKDVEAAEMGGLSLARFPNWGMLAGEVVETDKEIVVCVEVPGMEKDDCEITVEGNTLILKGEKHFERETGEGTFHLMERAYGNFERAIPLPQNVDGNAAEASYKNGVLSVRLPKVEGGLAKRITVH